MNEYPATAVFWHLPKTSGSFTGRYLKVTGRLAENGRPETPARHMSEAHRAIPVHVSCVRNPLDWYPSYYRNCLRINALGGEPMRAFAGWTNLECPPSFRRALFGWTHLPDEPLPLRRPFYLAARFDGLPSPVGPEGLYSWALRSNSQDEDGAWCITHLLATDRIYEALEAVFGERVDPEQYPPQGTSVVADTDSDVPALSDYRDWYDDEMIGWVRAADGWVFDLMGWDGFSAASLAVREV